MTLYQRYDLSDYTQVDIPYLSRIPDPEFLARLQHGDVKLSEARGYREVLYNKIQAIWIKEHGTEKLNSMLEHFWLVEEILDRMEPIASHPELTFEPQAPSSPTKRQLQPKEKTISQLEEEIISAATSTNPKVALTQVAALNGFSASLVEQIAKSLLKDQGMDSLYDLAKDEYQRCINEIRDIELKQDPGEKAWKLQDLARKYHRSVKEILEVYYKSLLVQHLEDPISLKEFKQQHPEGRKWLLRGWIPESSLVLFHGHGGIGKTLYTHHLIKHVVQGIDWSEYKVKSGCNGILYVQTDTALVSAVEALKQAGIPDDVPIQLHDKWRVEFMSYLYKWIEKQRPALVVIDSLTSVNRFSTVSENDTSYAQPILQMRDFAAEFGCSFVIIHHSNGAGEVRGTKAVRAAVDEVWRIERANKQDEADPKRLLVIEKSRSRITQRYEMQFDDDNFSWNLLIPEDENGKPTRSTSGRWLIVDHLNKYPGKKYCAEDLAQELRIPEATVRRELPNLFREGLIDREPNPKFTNNRSSNGESKHLYLVQG